MVKWLLRFASSKALQLAAKACLQASSLGPFHCAASFRAKAQLRVRPKGDWAQKRLLCQDPRQEQEVLRDPVQSDGSGKPHILLRLPKQSYSVLPKLRYCRVQGRRARPRLLLMLALNGVKT